MQKRKIHDPDEGLELRDEVVHALDEAEQEYQRGEFVSHDDLMKELGL